MPRNGSGTFTLVSGNPVVTGTTIESNWANTTLSDIATAMTDSLSRSGQGGMTAALRIADGTQGAPGLGFANETGSGLYRAGTAEVWAVVQGAQTMKIDSTGVTVPAAKATSIEGTFVFNEAGADKDARFEGDTDVNLLFTDASTDRVGIGTNTPTAKLNVEGSVIINDAGADVDVRIEGDTDANLLFTDASTDRVGVGTSAPANKLSVRGATQAKEVAVRWERATDGAVAGGLGYFYDAENSVAVGSVTNHPLKLIVNDATQATLTSTGLGIGTSSPAGKLTVKTGTNENLSVVTVGSGDMRLSALNDAGSATVQLSIQGSPLYFRGVGGTINATLDSSGNLGLGVTPSAWNASFKSLQVSNSCLYNNGAADTFLGANFYNDTGGTNRYTTSAHAAAYGQVDGAHQWYTAPSGTAGNAISFTQAMTLDASGNLGVGTTSPLTKLDVKFASNKHALFTASAGYSNGADLIATDDAGTEIALGLGGATVRLYTGATERARITSGGNFLINNTYTTAAKLLVAGDGTSNAAYAGLFADSAGANILALRNDGYIDTGTRALSPYNNTTGSAANMYVDSSGGLYRSTSSLKYKTDVQDATHGLAEVLQLRPVTYKGKNDGDTVFGGLIAEEVHAAGLTEFVQYAPDGSPDALAYGNMVSLLTKAIQEQQALITALTARVAALEAQP